MGRVARDCAVILAGVLVVVGLFTTAKFFASDRLAPDTNGIRGALLQRRIDYLFIGSSLTRQDYDVAALERSTGKRMYALAYNGLSPQFMKQVIAYLCAESRVSIGRVIIEASPLLSVSEDRLSDASLFLDAPYPLKIGILETIVRGSTGVDVWTRAWELVVASSNDAILSYPLTHRFLNQLSYKGGYASAKKQVPPMSQQKFASIVEPALPVGQQAGEMEAEAVLDIQRTLAANGIAFTHVEPPIPSARQRGRRFLTAKSALRGLIVPTGASHVDFAQEEFDFSNYEYFGDPVHMSTRGRAVYSELIAERIRSGRL